MTNTNIEKINIKISATTSLKVLNSITQEKMQQMGYKEKDIYEFVSKLHSRFFINLSNILSIQNNSFDDIFYRRLDNMRDKIEDGILSGLPLKITDIFAKFNAQQKKEFSNLKTLFLDKLSEFNDLLTPIILIENDEVRKATIQKSTHEIQKLFTHLKIFGNAKEKYEDSARVIIESILEYSYVAIQKTINDYIKPREKNIDFPTISEIKYHCEINHNTILNKICNINKIILDI